MMKMKLKLALLGTGNIGTSIADGLLQSGLYAPENIILTRRRAEKLAGLKDKGFIVQSDNGDAVRKSEIILIAVEPQQLNRLLEEVRDDIDSEKHLIISVVTGVSIAQIRKKLQKDASVIRAMPNTAAAIRESITCIASDGAKESAFDAAANIFNTVGRTLVIDEEDMTAATALGACGIAFFLRAIRAASQGGIEIGFNSDKALQIAAQTAKGAAALLLKNERHPEFEIDKVTTPRGVTISGLNQMEHQGFSSALIQGIVTSWSKASRLYKENGG